MLAPIPVAQNLYRNGCLFILWTGWLASAPFASHSGLPCEAPPASRLTEELLAIPILQFYGVDGAEIEAWMWIGTYMSVGTS